MLVKDAMTSPVISVSSQAPLFEAVNLLVTHRLSGLPVLDETGQLCGLISEGDLLRRIELGTAHRPGHWWSKLFSSYSAVEAYRMTNGRKVSDVMSHSPITIDGDATLADAARVMEKHGIKRTPVVQGGKLVGMLTRADFVKVLHRLATSGHGGGSASDRDIEDKIRAEVDAQPWSAICAVTITVENGRVTLTGMVPSGSHAEAIRVAAENVAGVLAVEQELEIVPPVVLSGL
ncbi:MAG: CBS domain-containing protein [Beijerinckiaceae bacterium]|nr:CBS domain-containing protein [Beijerinckiaceae bacterium]